MRSKRLAEFILKRRRELTNVLLRLHITDPIYELNKRPNTLPQNTLPFDDCRSVISCLLGDIKGGFYIDVGAYDPDHGSITKFFYEEGWHGVNIEPLQIEFQKLREKRPRDINLCLAVGAQSGRATFYEVSDGRELSGSTVSDGLAQERVRAGWSVKHYDVDCRTLDEICAKHEIGTVHFLKIDVEGAESSVLEGFSFSKVRPWLVIVEAIDSASIHDASSRWEPYLISKDYELVYYDGLNRFYLAKERWHLRLRLIVPGWTQSTNIVDYHAYPVCLGRAISRIFSTSVRLGLEETDKAFDNSGTDYIIIHKPGSKVVFSLTDSTRVDQVTGELFFSPDYSDAVVVAGPLANPTTAFYESRGFTPLRVQISRLSGVASGDNALFIEGNKVVYTVSLASLSATNDYFTMEAFQVNGQNTVLVFYGLNATGTLASGVYFDTNFANFNAVNYPAQAYIIHWQGKTPNTPLPSDTYTIVFHT